MSQPTSETFERLFAIPEATIQRDMERCLQDPKAFLAESKSTKKTARSDRDPRAAAHSRHLTMVSAWFVWHHGAGCVEERMQLAAFVGNWIAEDAAFIAHSKDELAKLSSAMDSIREREGLGEGDWWGLGEGPDDYLELNAKYDAISDRIRDTVFPVVLRRYQLGELADLFEHDRKGYEVSWEVGRRLAFPNSDDETFRRFHGDAAAARVETRLTQLRNDR